MTPIWFAVTAVVAYLILTLYLSPLVQQIPRRPVTDPPDWGTIEDTFVPAIDGGKLEVWRIKPEGESRGTVLLAHGWGRNRDRMVNRARMFGSLGYTTVIHSARDHGNSSPRFVMNALSFAEDIEAIIDWIGEPVILYGHSAGSGAAILSAVRQPENIQLLFLEASYAHTRPALLSLYRWFNWWVGSALQSILESELLALGTASGGLERNLGLLAEVLAQPAHWLYRDEVRMHLNAMGIKSDASSGGPVNDLQLIGLFSASGERRIVLPVRMPRSELPDRPEFFKQASRYLG